VIAHAQKPDFVFRRNGRVPLNRQGRQFSRLLAAEVCASAVLMVVMLDTSCSEVECKTAGYPLHSHVSPSFSLPYVTVCHHVSTGLYTQICCHNTDYVHINGHDRTITVILAKHCIKLPDDGSLVIRNMLEQF